MNCVRLIHLTIHSTALVIEASYSAALTSFLAVKSVYIPFTTIQGLIDDSTYTMGILEGSVDQILLKVRLNFAYSLTYISVHNHSNF